MTTKPFSQQMKECIVDGNLFRETCSSCLKILLMCKRFGGQCRSAKCREWRKEEKND